jgi:hypothetical protein
VVSGRRLGVRLHRRGEADRNRLLRSRADRARAVKSALDKADEVRTGKEKNATATIEQLDALAKQFEADAGSATGRDQLRLRSLAETIKTRAARLR